MKAIASFMNSWCVVWSLRAHFSFFEECSDDLLTHSKIESNFWMNSDGIYRVEIYTHLYSIISIYKTLQLLFNRVWWQKNLIFTHNPSSAHYQHMAVPLYIYMNLWLELDNWHLWLSWLEHCTSNR
jgi:hypothetical protein